VGRTEAADVVIVHSVGVVGVGLGAGTGRSVDHVAVLEVADLVGDGDVVRVGRPDHAGVLAGGRVHRVERVRLAGAGGRVRVEAALAEAVGEARGHRADLPAGQVDDVDLEAGRGVVQRHGQVVAAVHEQVLVLVRGEGRIGRPQRVGRRLGPSVVGDEREVHRFDTDLGQARRVVGDAVV